MSTALEYIYSILSGFANFLFNQAFLFSGVSLGLVIICIWVMGMIIRNIVNLPSKSSSFNVHSRDRGDE